MSSGSDVCLDLAELDTQARTKARRKRAALREQRRAHELNKAFDDLQKCLPFIPVCSRIPKRTIIELAIQYIRQMQDQLLNDSANVKGKLETVSNGDSVLDALCASAMQGSQSVDAPVATSSRELLCQEQFGLCQICGCDPGGRC